MTITWPGNTTADQRDPTPFIIEWIPDILPKSHIGELRIKFEYGHQRNGHIENRQAMLDGQGETTKLGVTAPTKPLPIQPNLVSQFTPVISNISLPAIT